MGLGWLWWCAWGPLLARDAAALLRGRRDTWWHPLALCVARMALGDIDLFFAWQAWHLWDWAGSGGALGPLGRAWRCGTFAWQAWHLVTSTCTLRGKHGAWWHRPFFCVAGVALMGLGWVWRRAWGPLVAREAAALFCVAGVTLGDIHLRFAWQAWHLVTSTFGLPGRRGTYGTSAHARNSCAHHLCHTTLSHSIFRTHLSHTALSHKLFVAHHHSQTALSHTIFRTQLHSTTLSHTIFHAHLSHTNFVTHHLLSQTIFHTPSLSHTIFHTHLCLTPSFTHHLCHTPSFTRHLCHTPSFTRHFVAHPFTHNFVTPQLCHTPSFTHIFHTQLCHIPSLWRTIFHTHTHIFRTPALSHTIFHTNHLSHTIFVTQHLSHTTLSHATLSQATLSHTHTQTQIFTYKCLSDRSSTTSFIYPSFPIPLGPLFLLIGRSCLVGSSGPSIFLVNVSLNVWVPKAFK